MLFVVAWHPGNQLVDAGPAGLRGTSAMPLPPGKGPPTRRELGHGTWGLLHRMAAKFPKDPTQEDKDRIVQFLNLLGHLFPCSECAGHFRAMIKEHPPQVGSNLEYSMWLCKVHNIVNRRVGNPVFVCEKEALQERWGDCGCFDGSEEGSAGATPVGTNAGVGVVTAPRQ